MTVTEKFKRLENIASPYADADLEEGKHYWLHNFSLKDPMALTNSWEALYTGMIYRGVFGKGDEEWREFWTLMAEVAKDLGNWSYEHVALEVMDW